MQKPLFALPLLALLAASLPVHAAKVYRCPDGSYADKPCGEGAKVVTTTRRASSDNPAERLCLALGEEAMRIAKQKAGGMSVSQAIAAVENQYVPFEEKAARKKLVVTVYQTPGTPSEARSLVEADCVTKEKDAKAAREAQAAREAREAAAAKANAQKQQTAEAPAAAPAPAATAALSPEQCKQLKQTMAAMSAGAAAGLDDDAPQKPNAAQNDATKQFKQYCP